MREGQILPWAEVILGRAKAGQVNVSKEMKK
jgi:hypothetical protein